MDFEIAIRQFARDMSERGFKNPIATGSNFLVIGFENESDVIDSSTGGWSVVTFDPYKEASNHVFGVIEKTGTKSISDF